MIYSLAMMASHEIIALTPDGAQVSLGTAPTMRSAARLRQAFVPEVGDEYTAIRVVTTNSSPEPARDADGDYPVDLVL